MFDIAAMLIVAASSIAVSVIMVVTLGHWIFGVRRRVSNRKSSECASGQPILTVVAESRQAGLRPPVPRQLLGLGIVLLTIIPAYTVSRVTAAHEKPGSVYGFADRREDRASGIDDHIGEVAARYSVPKNLVVAIIEAESEFDPLAVSRRGALGLMQLMPATAEILGVSDPFDPRENIEGGVRHLRAMMDRFDNDLPLALAAYNAGERAVIRHGGIPPYRETRQYVSRILRCLDRDRAKSLDQGSTWAEAECRESPRL